MKESIKDFPEIWKTITPRQRVAIEFCERVLSKKCGKDFVSFLNKSLKKQKKLVGAM